MLKRLKVDNLAIVEHAEATFGGGLTVITGETGAGKSVFMGALTLALGARADASSVRDGCKEARIEAEFDSGDADALLDEQGLPACEGGVLLVRRVISATGGSRVWINDSATSVQTLRALGDRLVDIHGPNDRRSLVDEDFQRDALDRYGKVDLRAYSIEWRRLSELRARRAELAGAVDVADEVERLSARIDKMAELVEKSVDIDRLLEIAATAPDIREEPYRLEPIAGARPIVAVARDETFSFYYEENLRALEDLGCELAFFSPLCDSELPRGTSALYLGGGYPELHARQLSENAPMRDAVRRAVESGMPTVAECGGFLYLQREIADSEGRRWPVAGALEGSSENGGRLSHFGYVELTSQRDGLYGPRGTRIRAHEFHYWQSTCPGGDFWAQKPRRDKGWPCMTTTPSLVAGFPHVYYPANPDVARAFASAAASFAERRRHG